VLSKVLSDSARALSGAPEATCSYGGAFRMLQDLTYRIVNFEASETSVQICWRFREKLRPLRSFCERLGAAFSQQWFLHNYKAFRLIIFVFVTSCYGIHYLSLSIYIHTVNLAADSTRAQLEEHLDTPIEHPDGNHEKEQFWIAEFWNPGRRYHTTHSWGSKQLGRKV
jgi:hypothetical protein